MKILKVSTKEECIICDGLLTDLIQSERKYDNNVLESFVVKDMYFNKLSDNNGLFLISEDDCYVGFIYGYLKFLKGDFVMESVARIEALYVLENYRRKGYASELINEFTKWCNLKDIKNIEIGVFLKNTSAYHLYKKLGFIDDIVYLKKGVDYE